MKLSKEQKLLSDILNVAWEDESFKQRLIANPLVEIENLTGQKIELPDGKKLIVQDQTSSSKIYINIPPKPQMDDVELNEEQLDMVSGGVTVTPPKLGDPASVLNGLLGG